MAVRRRRGAGRSGTPRTRRLLFLLSAALLAACGPQSAQTTPCDALTQRQAGITREEYAPCAGEILAALDVLQPEVKAFVGGAGELRLQARESLRRARGLIRKTRVEFDYASMRARKPIERWPDSKVRAFNEAIIDASVRYNAALAYPNREDFDLAAKAHAKATSLYRQIR